MSDKPLYKTRHMLDDFCDQSLGLDFDGDSIGLVNLLNVGFETRLIRMTYEVESGDEYEDIIPLMKGVDDDDIDSYVSIHVRNMDCKIMQYSYEILDETEAAEISLYYGQAKKDNAIIQDLSSITDVHDKRDTEASNPEFLQVVQQLRRTYEDDELNKALGKV